jgi:hypothetical protein
MGCDICYTNDAQAVRARSHDLTPRHIMRALFALLALLGVAGIVIGVRIILRAMNGPNGVPFHFESYGGPGPIIAGLIVLATSLYLLSTWKPKD